MPEQERATFHAAELAVVLSHFDLGVIESITDFLRGSRQSPKAGIVCERGKFLLKRLAPKRADPQRVRFSHRVQRRLEDRGFPAPKLQATRDGGYTCLSLRDHLYELFTFVPGQAYGHSIPETQDAGAVLARFHLATETLVPSATVGEPRGDYHDAAGIRTGLCAIGSSLGQREDFGGDEDALSELMSFLLVAYDRAADTVNRFGLTTLPERLIHSDWHPGNLLFRKGQVAGVVDYDSVRWSRQVIDVANGALQFSIVSGGDPAQWPDHIDEDRWHAFLAAYESVRPLSELEHRCIPHLMSEALVAECVPPITQTGSVGPWRGFGVLQMVRRKIAWLDANHERLARSVIQS